MTFRKFARICALCIVSAWLLSVVSFVVFQGVFLYPFDVRGVFAKPPKGFAAMVVEDGGFVPFKDATVGGEPAGSVRVWRAAPKGTPRGRLMVLVGAHGTPRTALSRAAPFVERGWEVVIVVYPGTVGTAGTPSQEELVRVSSEVLGAFDAPPVIYGYSMGGALAVLLAADAPVGGLLLEAPLAEIWPLVRGHAPWLAPVPFALSDPWAALSAAPDVRAPAWVVHGVDDDVVPVEQGRLLARALRTGIHEVVGGGHRNLPKLGLIEGLSEVAEAGQDGWWLAAQAAFPAKAASAEP